VIKEGTETALLPASAKPSATCTSDLEVLDSETVGPANDHPVPSGHSVAQLCTAITAIRAHVPLGAATIAVYDPDADQTQAVCRATLAVLGAMLAPTS
jgi:arginase family enzyme